LRMPGQCGSGEGCYAHSILLRRSSTSQLFEHWLSCANNFLGGCCSGFHSHRAPTVFSTLFRVLLLLLWWWDAIYVPPLISDGCFVFLCSFSLESRGFTSLEASQPHGKLLFLHFLLGFHWSGELPTGKILDAFFSSWRRLRDLFYSS